MTENQLKNLRKRVGPHPNLDQNGQLLHLINPIGAFNEWVVLTYNLQVLGDQIKENSKLREKLDDVVETYVKQLETLCKIRPAGPAAYPIPTLHGTVSPYAGDAMPYWMAMMNQRLEDMEKRFRKMEELMMDMEKRFRNMEELTMDMAKTFTNMEERTMDVEKGVGRILRYLF